MSRDLLAEIGAIVGHAHVLQGDAAASYLVEWRGAFEPCALAVVRPADTQAVSAVVNACARHDCAVVAQSGNTGLVGGAAASDPRNQIVLSLAP